VVAADFWYLLGWKSKGCELSSVLCALEWDDDEEDEDDEEEEEEEEDEGLLASKLSNASLKLAYDVRLVALVFVFASVLVDCITVAAD